MEYDKRGLYVDEAHLERFAENFARSLAVEGVSGGRGAAAALRASLRDCETHCDALALKWAGIPSMPGAVRWLLDNRWLIRREGAAAARELAGAESLRYTAGGTVLERLCESLLSSGRGELSDQRIALFLRGFQRTLILEREELALLVCALKGAAVRELDALSRSLADGAEEDAETDAARLVTALRELGVRDFRKLLERADAVEQTLLRDPAGVYPRMAERSRAFYRACLSRLARRRGMAEHTAARRILTLAEGGRGAQRHVGWWLLRAPLGEQERGRGGGIYIAANMLLTLFLSLLAGFAAESFAAFALLLVPVSELVKQSVDFALLHCTRPVHVPRLALPGGIPPEGKTLCVVAVLLCDPAGAEAAVRALEETRLLNRDAGENLRFALLADLPDGPTEASPREAEAALAAATEAIDDLNRRSGGAFFLLTRPRLRTAEGRWQGWERKRGALLETMRFLRGQPSAVRAAAGDAAALSDVHYLLILDGDTRMTPGAAKEMVGAMLHPLNRPKLDHARGVVTEGYAVLSPRVGLTLSAAGRSDFTRIFAGLGGTDPYGGACSELNMDLFGRGGFTGKGILDIDAYLACMGKRVPDNLMLSHDAVEGAFLRCGFLGDVELTDSFPGGVLPFLRRLERWTRGDWQNLPWLFRKGRELPHLEKWKLFDSLRRSLVPVATLAAIVLGLFSPAPGLTLAAAAALLCALSELLLTCAETLLQPDGERVVRYRSVLFVGAGGGLVRTLLRLLLLPAEAWTCFSAAVRALWRLGVSHRKLLQWQTADDSERTRSDLARCCRELWFSPLLGILLLGFSPGVVGIAAGALWLLGPLCAALLSLPSEPPITLRAEEREYLLGCARDTWKYYVNHIGPADHGLPPDNVQVQPPAGAASRVSPTNAGLTLLSILSAMDLGFEPVKSGLRRITAVLDTLEALPKWKGHLYNWYDSRSLTPLEPRYVSTVDSGNLCACLIALREGLLEYGAPEQAVRADALAGAMRFAPLFDDERKLFYIGLDVSAGRQASDAWYDLLASEARLTAYLAVARGDVPREHWRRLSRALLQLGPYRGMASWTGTMFEYLMPELLLPPERNSLLWESMRFCLFAQQRRVKGLHLPWGVSESAYRALDPGMTYRYKAHGCAHLALKSGMDDELVLSPYSSFLALAVRPHAAIANLRRLESMDMRGPWGFWEALDCTPERCGGAPKPVRAVFAHHAGMSLIAAENLLLDGKMRRRFLSDRAMSAYRCLLQERIPVGGAVLKTPGAERRRPIRAAASESWSAEGAGVDFRNPRCCMLAGESYTLLCTESGLTRARWGALAPYVSPRSPLDREKGVELFLDLGGRSLPLLPDASRQIKAQYRWQLRTDRAEYYAADGALEGHVEVSLAEDDAGERRRVTLANRGGEAVSADLVLRFRPLLADEADYESHPAFWGLGLSARTERGCLLLRRLERGKQRELWMCLAADRPCGFDLAPGAGSGRAGQPIPAAETEYYLTEPLVTAVCPVALEPGGSAECVFALGMAYDADGALAAAQRVLSSDSRADLPRSAAAVLGLDAAAVEAAFAMLPALSFPAAPAGSAAQSALWPFGISGDLPIAAARYADNAQLDRASALMNAHLFLCGCGACFDLVFLSRDGASYRRPLRTALSDALWRAGGELLRDAGGGIHIVEDTPEAEVIRHCAALRLSLDCAAELPARDTAWRSALPSRQRRFPLQSAPEYRFEHGSFQFYVNLSLPRRAWQNVLCNGRFGALATDCGAGYLWMGNAREYQLTPWRGLPSETTGPERLELETDGESVSLFAAPEDRSCRVRYLPGAAVWEKRAGSGRVRTTAFVPPDADCRVLLIELDGTPHDAVLHWFQTLQLAARSSDARFCRTTAGLGGLLAENVRGGKNPYQAYTFPLPEGFTCERSSALARVYDGAQGRFAEPVFALRLRPGQTAVLVCGCDRPEALRALAFPAAAKDALARTLARWRGLTERLQLESPCADLNHYVNSWALYQIVACRLLGRSSVYQCGGAYGFRDQLQDAVNLIPFDAAPAREQILRCCLRQYAEGDVQHWWHVCGDVRRGLRTRCSDDLLWLPWAVCEYVEQTGDESVCGEQLPYLVSPPLAAEERDRFESPPSGDKVENVLRHCQRALALVMDRGRGPHGLLRIGAGDWNDGFDAVGGESVWLTWFFLHVAERFTALAPQLAPPESFLSALADAANAAWDGDRFLRGWYADGAPLGGRGNAECAIDSVAQSWAAFCGCADPEKTDTALTTAVRLLYDRENRIVKLFDPPFAGLEQPGYISSYGPGFRENGGQYTHAALWLVRALLCRDRREEAWEILSALLPASRGKNYLCEPYVLAADVYTAPGHVGEGGWSWYTGAAGWLLRIVTEDLLGLRLRGGNLTLQPRLPAALTPCTVRFLGREYHLPDDA